MKPINRAQKALGSN